jgi:hypothetical protein
MPGQVFPQPKLVDETDGVAVRLKEVVVELLEPCTSRPSRLEAGRKAPGHGFALEHGDLVAALRQAQRGSQAEGAGAEDGRSTSGIHGKSTLRIVAPASS